MTFGSYQLNFGHFENLVSSLIRDNFVIGPRMQGSAIMLGKISSLNDLARGYEEEMEPGTYRLIKTGSPFFFSAYDNTKQLERLSISLKGKALHPRKKGRGPHPFPRACL